MSEMPSSAMSFSVGPLGSSLATSCSSRSRSTRSRATACSRWLTPLSGTSALAMAMIRLRTRCGDGWNSSVSTPSGTTWSWSALTAKSSAMSAADVEDTVTNSGISRATVFCISANPYHRRTSGLRHHLAAATSRTRSRVMGWCTVATTGRPDRAMDSSPVPRHWLSCTTSKSSRRSASSRAARRLKVLGSGKAAVQVANSSCRSIRVLISLGIGMRNGSGSR